MIDDLFTDLTVGAVGRLLSPDTARDEADFGLASLNARLSPSPRGDHEAEGERPTDDGPEFERRLFSQYLSLNVDDLEQIPQRVHEWMLDRLSSSAVLDHGIVNTLRTLYFLFPDSTVRHAVVGLLVQAGAVNAISDGIATSDGLSPDDRSVQTLVLVDLLLDYLDVFPDATLRTLNDITGTRRDERVQRHLINWSERLGGELGARVRRVIG